MFNADSSFIVCLFVCFVALRPKSTAMVIAARSVHLPHFFLGKLEEAVNQYFVHILSLVTDNNDVVMMTIFRKFVDRPSCIPIYA